MKSSKNKLPSFFNWHLLFIVALIAIIIFAVSHFANWGTFVDLKEIFKDGPAEVQADTLDLVLPPPNGKSNDVNGDGVVNMLVFGNSPFADDRDSKDSLANMIAEQTGANVYNCSISGSYLTAQNYYFDGENDLMDAYCLYWLTSLAITKANDGYYLSAAKGLGEAVPPDADEVWRFLYELDMSTIDVVTIMYDATDYLMGNLTYNSDNSTDILRFVGNLEAGIEMIQYYYPDIRIFVMSPTYAFALDDDGNYISSDMKAYDPDNENILSTYSILEANSSYSRGVTFIDHLYGTITEDNAKDYLIDNIHLNEKGREAVAERFTAAYKRYVED